jgi:hypothetical protein
MALSLWASSCATKASVPIGQEPSPENINQVIVQIDGRFCEYYRDDVEAALRRHSAVRSVEFLNDHGKVLVRYQNDMVPVTQLVESVRMATKGFGCKTWVDRGASGAAPS